MQAGMRSCFCAALAAVMGGLAGCAWVKERMDGPAPESRLFPFDRREVYRAAREAVEESGLRFVRGGPAQGELEAISPIRTATASGRARQLTARFQFRETRPNETEVLAWVTAVEETSMGGDPPIAMGVRQAPAESLEVIFGRMEEILAARRPER